jgi:hypothetical protein
MTIIIAVIGFAALFGLAAGLRSQGGCGHDCGACSAVCSLDGEERT